MGTSKASRPARRAGTFLGRLLLRLSAAATAALLLFLVGVILVRGLPHISWTLLTTEESVLNGTVGILPSIVNTLFVVVLTLVIALPLGVGAAIYLTEYAKNRRLAAAIQFAADILAGIPSILYALVGVILFCTAMGLRKTLVAGSLTLVMMVLPTILRTTQESLRTVPQSYREGALGLGAGRWHMIYTVVLPSAVDGIVTGCILSIGRVVGESAVLLYTAGLSTSMQSFAPGRIGKASGATLSAALYLFAKERSDMDTAFAIAVILLVLTVLIGLAARLAGKKLKK